MSGTHQWIVVADARTATMYRCQFTPGREWHLESVGSVANSHEREHQRGRPSELSGQGRGAMAHGSPHMASLGHGEEEEHHKFAISIAERDGWLARALAEHKADHVQVFAPPAFLGVLRHVMATKGNHEGGALIGRTTLLEGELANLTPGQLATHPRIVQALGSSAS